MHASQGQSIDEVILTVKFTREPVIPLAFGILTPFFIRSYLKIIKGNSVIFLEIYAIHMTWCVLFISNIHLVSGYTISYKNIIDYAVSLMGGLALVLYFSVDLLEHRNTKPVNRMIIIFVLCISIVSLRSNGFDFSKGYFRIYRGAPVSLQEKELIKNNPSEAIISNLNISSKIAYGFPNTVAPPFAYQYYFLHYDAKRLDLALHSAKLKYGFDSELYTRYLKTYNTIKSRSTPLMSSQFKEDEHDFFFVVPNGETWIFFPDYRQF